VVCEASRSSQEVITGTVGTLLEKVIGRELSHLNLIYVGDNLASAASLRHRVCAELAGNASPECLPDARSAAFQ
jgi:hypothetical protein